MSDYSEHTLAQQVDLAFEAARTGNFGPSSELQHVGESVVPMLKPYLTDSDEAIRRQVVMLLGQLDGDAAVPLLAVALTDTAVDIRQRAAEQLYEHYDPTAFAKQDDVGRALRESVSLENDTAAAVLLLSYFRGDETKRVLKNLLAEKKTTQTKLFPWSPTFPLAVPIEIALSRLGDNDARRALLERIAKGRLEELEFMLQVMREVDAPEVLHALKAALADEREISAGLPAGVEPRLRLADLAVNAFVERLGLKVDFKLEFHQRYDEAAIDQVKELIDATLPQ